jgi:hypothetical protein
MHAIEKTVKRMVVSIAKEDAEFLQDAAIGDGQKAAGTVRRRSAHTRHILKRLNRSAREK